MIGKKAETKRDHRGELVRSVTVLIGSREIKSSEIQQGEKSRKPSLTCQDPKTL